MRFSIICFAAFLSVRLMAAEQPATLPATESMPVEKDQVAVSVVLQRATFSADEQPEFTVRFKNVGMDYRNLYDVAAYWNWTIDLTSTDLRAPEGGPWRLRMHTIPNRNHIDHRQIKRGETTEALVNLNNPPFTFCYDYLGPLAGKRIQPIRNLQAGHYRLTVTVALSSPFGDGHQEWSGPITTWPVELTITASTPKTQTKDELAAYDAAIAGVTDKLASGGLWTNGVFPKIDLPSDAKTDDVIDAAVNQTSLDTKVYRVLKLQPFKRNDMADAVSGTAALLHIGKTYKVVILFPFGKSGWWSRFYDTEVLFPMAASAD